jgi:hypothetical protein
MDKNKYPAWEAREDAPPTWALLLFLTLWGFFASAATMYCSTLGL